MTLHFVVLLALLSCLAGCSRDERMWKEVAAAGTPEKYASYIETIGPEGKHYQQALEATEAALWAQAEQVTDYQSYAAWRGRYPAYVDHKDRSEAALQLADLDARMTASRAEADVAALEDGLAEHVKKFGAQNRLVLKGLLVTDSPAGKFTLSGRPGGGGGMMLSEFPGDHLVYAIDMESMGPKLDPLGSGSISRVRGEASVGGLEVQPWKGKPAFVAETLQSDPDDKFNRLTFVLLKDIGLVYLRGNGVVRGKQGEIATLGSTSTKPAAATPAN